MNELDLSHNPVSDNVLYGAPIDLSREESKKYVKSKLRAFKALNKLNLSDTLCTSHTLKFLKFELPVLRAIYLNRCYKFNELPENLKLPQSLRILSLNNTPIKKIPNLKTRFPDLKVICRQSLRMQKKGMDSISRQDENPSNGKQFPVLLDKSQEIFSKQKYMIFLKDINGYPHKYTHFKQALTHAHSLKELEFLCSMDPDDLKFVLDMPEDDLGENWQNYIVRKPGWNQYYNNADQELFGKWMHHTCKIVCRGIKENNWDFDQVLLVLENRRGILAELLGFRSFHKVGIRRTPPEEEGTEMNSFTRCLCEYEIIPKRVKETWVADGSTLVDATPTDFIEGRIFDVYAQMNGKNIKLSQVTYYDSPRYSFAGLDNRPSIGDVIHPSPEKAQEIMDFVKNDLYPQALQEKDPDKLTEDLGRIFWWICQAKPWILGDPSIAETVIRSIWMRAGHPNPPWNKNIVPWIEVILEHDVDQFAKKFHTLFDAHRE